LDDSATSHEAVAELQAETLLPDGLLMRTNHYLNNLLPQNR